MVPASSGPAARRSWGTGGVAGGQGASRRGEHDFPLDVYVPLEDGGVVQAGHADGFAVTERGEDAAAICAGGMEVTGSWLVSIPAIWRNSMATTPGQQAWACTPVPASSPARPG